MANLPPADHPITEIIARHADVYGPEASSLIRDIIAERLTARELFDWWQQEIGWDGTPYLALESARSKAAELSLARAA